MIGTLGTSEIDAYSLITLNEQKLLTVRATPKDGKYQFVVFLKCDCYLGRDRAYLMELESTSTTLTYGSLKGVLLES